MTSTWLFPVAAGICFSSIPALAQSVNDPIATTDVPASTPAVTAAAGTPVEPAAPPTPCTAKIFTPGEGKPGDLIAICSGEGVRLGPSISFAAAWNETLGRYVVVNRTEDGERVYMIRPKSKAEPTLIEDLTNDLAATARRLKDIQVKALEGGVDISGFASGGAIRLTGAASKLPVAAGVQPVAVRIANEGGIARAINPALEAATKEQPSTATIMGD